MRGYSDSLKNTNIFPIKPHKFSLTFFNALLKTHRVFRCASFNP